MLIIPINYNDIKFSASGCKVEIEGIKYTITVRSPLLDKCYYMDMTSENGNAVLRGHLLTAKENLLRYTDYTELTGILTVIETGNNVTDADLRYPMLGNGWELHYITLEEQTALDG